MCNLLMHVSIPSIHFSSLSLGFLYFSFSSLFSLFSFLSFYLSLLFIYLFKKKFFWPLFLSPFHCSRLQPLIMLVGIRFPIFTSQPLLAHCGHPSKTAHWPAGYPDTTTTLCWLHHASFPNKSGFVLSLTSLNTLIRIRVKPLPYQPLWHASSDSSSCLFLLDEMSSQQDISPKRA